MNSFADLRNRIQRPDSERGAILILTALVMLLLLFIAAFATDLGAWYRQGEEQQRAADVGSLNGVAAFDREARAFLGDRGVTEWVALSAADQAAAETQAFQATVETVQALLETSGLTFPDPPGIVLSTDPNGEDGNFLDNNSTSTATLVAADGSVITITRSFVENGDDGAGNPVFTRVVDVSVERNGEQFFSDIVRDAPTIDRSAQALLSNCGAICNQELSLNPPFVGFGGNGNGDGYAPLLFDSNPSTNGFDEVWAVNHHSDGRNNGQIICQIISEEPTLNGNDCAGAPYGLDYQTGNRPVEFISDTGQIYYAARDRDTDRTGLACFDTTTRSNCGTPFIGLFDQPDNPSFPGWINVHGPFENEGRLYLFSQDGQGVCVTFTMQRCNNGPITTLPGLNANDTRLPDLQDRTYHVSNGEQFGGELVLTQNTRNGVFFHCLDLSANNGTITNCQGVSAPIYNNTLGNGGDDNLTFTRYNTSGQPNGVCVLNIITENNGCVNIGSGSSIGGGFSNAGELPGLRAGLSELGRNWGGDTFSWRGLRTFFAGGNSNLVGCWDWQTQSACTTGDNGTAYIETNNARTNGLGNAFPYGFAQVADRCIIGLGHQAIFFSFDPVGFGPCDQAAVATPIGPCDCTDGSGTTRYGLIRVPPNLLAVADEIFATVNVGSDFGPVLTDLDGVPIERIPVHSNGGVIDLTNIDQSLTGLWLTLEVNARINPDGSSAFTERVDAVLEIDVQPTLTQ